MRLCRFCFGLVIYINIYITHVKILIYFTSENHFLSIGFFIFWTGLPPNRTGIPLKPVGIPVRTVCTTRFEFKLAFARYPTGSRPNRTGKPVPDLAGSVRSVGSVNPAGNSVAAAYGHPWELHHRDRSVGGRARAAEDAIGQVRAAEGGREGEHEGIASTWRSRYMASREEDLTSVKHGRWKTLVCCKVFCEISPFLASPINLARVLELLSDRRLVSLPI
jgi:hypothetical protein